MRYTVPRPKVLVIGYPSNPTAEVVDLAFYEKLVAFARVAGLTVISDLAYALYKGRRDVMIDSFARAGWTIPVPLASMLAWSPIPEPFRHLGSVEFAKKLMTEAHIAVAPGVGFGEEGEGFVRLALVENEQRLRQAARGIKKMMSAL